MTVLTITRNFLLHEGGTKYYQVVFLELKVRASLLGEEASHEAVMLNYGKVAGVNIRPGEARPVNSGQNRLHPEHGFYFSAAKVNEKLKRGYRSHWHEMTHFDTTDKATAEIQRLFGVTNGYEVRKALGLTDAGGFSIDAPAPVPMKDLDDSTIEATAHEYPATWGSW